MLVNYKNIHVSKKKVIYNKWLNEITGVVRNSKKSSHRSRTLIFPLVCLCRLTLVANLNFPTSRLLNLPLSVYSNVVGSLVVVTLKSCDRCAVHLQPYSALLLTISFPLQKSLEWCSVAKILLNKTCMRHKPVFATEHLFCNNPNEKSHGLFVMGTMMLRRF